MAKKGGVQQLQTEINTNEELIKFLDRDGLIVLDVYTEWCGPCLAMIGSLKKIKLEQGGDDLHLAVVKCDKIDALARFRNKCEPTWLLASKGKLVNCAYGANVPHLVELILKELDIERRTRDTDPETSGRNYYELKELTPVEQERFDIIQKMEDENERIEVESAHRRRIDYFTFVTDEIMKNSNDMGVTILMPHVISRDLLKRLTEPADKCHLVAKDKKNVQILNEHIDILALFTTDLMSRYLVDHISNRDVFAVCWKITDSNVDGDKNVEEYLNSFVQLVWNEEDESASLLKAISIAVETDIEADDEAIEGKNSGKVSNEDVKEEPKEEMTTENEIDATEISNENESEIVAEEQQQEETETNEVEDSNDNTVEGEETLVKTNEEEEKPKDVEEKRASERTTPITPMSLIRTKNYIDVKIPPIWTPFDKRTNAALIYLYFRSLTETYLPPDPPVVRPHLAIIFDAYKRREIMDVIDQYRDDVLAYGYFTTDNCETAQLIANSTFNYHKNPPTIYDKFILKVAKTRNSPLLAALKALGPSYISRNTEEGKTECLAFFPPGYKNSSETGETTPVPVDETQKKKKKKKRKAKHDSDEENGIDNSQDVKSATQAPTDVETTEEHEDGTELDDEDSADDDDSGNEANEIENVAETTET